jgi:hypothetical protein
MLALLSWHLEAGMGEGRDGLAGVSHKHKDCHCPSQKWEILFARIRTKNDWPRKRVFPRWCAKNGDMGAEKLVHVDRDGLRDTGNAPLIYSRLRATFSGTKGTQIAL